MAAFAQIVEGCASWTLHTQRFLRMFYKIYRSLIRREFAMPRLADKVAILTGAASGIGRGTAELFAEHGARLVLVDRDEPGLAETSARVKNAGAGAIAVCGDVSQSATTERVVAATLESFGQIDVVFNNAGIMPYGDLQQVSEETWDEVQAVNVKAMFLMCKAVIPHMLQRGKGSIINTSSVMATLTEPGYEAYTTSKAGVLGLSKALAVSYAEQGVRVNALCPGWVETPKPQGGRGPGRHGQTLPHCQTAAAHRAHGLHPRGGLRRALPGLRRIHRRDRQRPVRRWSLDRGDLIP